MRALLALLLAVPAGAVARLPKAVILPAGVSARVLSPATKLELRRLASAIPPALTPDLLKKDRRAGYDPENPLKGHCYVASEAAYQELGGKKAGWKPMRVRHEGDTHWFLKHESGVLFDLTAPQFEKTPPYADAVGSGFMTKKPSKRARALLRRIR